MWDSTVKTSKKSKASEIVSHFIEISILSNKNIFIIAQKQNIANDTKLAFALLPNTTEFTRSH